MGKVGRGGELVRVVGCGGGAGGDKRGKKKFNRI